MGQACMVVEIKVKPGKRDAFAERVREYGASCLDREPGCLRYDVLVPDDGGDRVFLYEIYADRAAREAHAATARMAAYRKDTDPMVVERIRTPCAPVDN